MLLHLLLCAALAADSDPVTYRVDPAQTTIAWRGTKGFGTGSHSGVVRVERGEVTMRGRELVGGSVIIDMRTIEVTDIPPSDPVPRRQLTEHLAGDDFFAVRTYRSATLQILSATRAGNRYDVSANLTMRGVTRRITFPAVLVRNDGGQLRARAELTLDRHRWGVAFSGRIRDQLVDDEFTLRIDITARLSGARS